MQNHNDDTIKTNDTVLYKNIPLTLFERIRKGYSRFYYERELETEQNRNILTPTRFFPVILVCSTGGLGAHSTGCWFSLPHLIYNWLNLLCTELYNSSMPTLLVGVTNRTHSTRPRSRLYSDIPRPDAPVIYTGSFPILTAWPGRRSIYNTFIPGVYAVDYFSPWFRNICLKSALTLDNPIYRPSARTGYDTRSIFKLNLTGLNSEFSFS